jgi:C1A family cysteine protease
MEHRVLRSGWVPDLPDHRDFAYQAPRPVLKKLPKKVDLRHQCPPVYDQGQLGSCTANAIGAAFEFELKKANGKDDFMPSRLFIYYNERAMEHTVKSDSGAQIRDGIKSVNKQGVCTETMWPYNINKFASKPKASCYTSALKHQVLSYHRVPTTLNEMKGCLAEGYPFVFGFTVYEAFESEQVAKTGKLNMPKPNEQVVGGHAVMAVGYDDAQQRFTIRNSWGPDWGMKGYFTMPYEYLLNDNLSDDFWTIRIVELNPALKKASKK